jgi:5-methylcytosine-specific restriction endonuclease McrA
MRRIWLMRNPACNRCGLAGEEVHHIVARKDAPHRWDDWNNLESLCHACHVKHHNHG